MNDNIPYLSEAEKAASISYIVDNGVRCQNGISLIRDVVDTLGLRALFFGVEDCLFIAVMLTILLGAFSAAAAMDHAPIAPLLFLLSPALYAVLHLLTVWKDAMSRTLEWKHTCRLSARAVTALRMLCFGGMAVFVCVLQCLMLWRITQMLYSLPWMMSISFSSLFLYAALSLALQSVRRWIAAAAPVAWIAAGIMLLCTENASAFLLKIPAIVFFLITAAATAMLIFQIRRYITRPIEGGLSYAVR